MKKMLLALVLLTALAPVTFADGANLDADAVVETQAPVELQEEVELQDEVLLEEASLAEVLPMTALDIATQEATNNYECPWYTTYCRFDFQCDSYCGGAGAGACSNGCCACYF